MWHVSAFLALGFLVGNLVGLTAESTISGLLGLLFAFAGGSAITFMHTLSFEERKAASQALMSLSLSCLLGVYIGILVAEHQLLSPVDSASESRASVEARKYLREDLSSKAQSIDSQLDNGLITHETAYDEMYALVLELGREQ